MNFFSSYKTGTPSAVFAAQVPVIPNRSTMVVDPATGYTPGSNNFQQWNPTQNNQESDAYYAVEGMRVNGAVDGAYPSNIHNKLAYQLSTAIVALTTAMQNKGYNVVDSNLANLIAVFEQLITTNDMANGAYALLSGAQSIASETEVLIDFVTGYGTQPGWWNVAAPSRITVPPGVNFVNLMAQGYWLPYAVGSRALAILWNGQIVPGMPVAIGVAGADYMIQNISSNIFPVTPGDYFELVVGQDSGAAVYFGDAVFTWFNVMKVG